MKTPVPSAKGVKEGGSVVVDIAPAYNAAGSPELVKRGSEAILA
jgi:hypothetical protein